MHERLSQCFAGSEKTVEQQKSFPILYQKREHCLFQQLSAEPMYMKEDCMLASKREHFRLRELRTALCSEEIVRFLLNRMVQTCAYAAKKKRHLLEAQNFC